jgi:hypothetical protein
LGNGADGFAFVIQNQGTSALAGRGSAGGFALGDGWGDRSKPGIPRSIAVFFDTHRNEDANDPSDNYVALCTNGPVPSMKWPPSRLGVARKLPVRLKDGRVHLVRILYKPPVLTVAFDDGEPVLRASMDARTVADEAGEAYVGFTAATGAGFENHDILAWSFHGQREEVSSQLFHVESTISFATGGCLEGRNLCTPPKAVVEQSAPGRFHVILPAHLEWSASIPNASMSQVKIANLQGHVCWDPAAPDGCPAPAALLIQKSEQGRTLFSINFSTAPQRRARHNWEGFLEFDAVID